jgi:hypothetical protein
MSICFSLKKGARSTYLALKAYALNTLFIGILKAI